MTTVALDIAQRDLPVLVKRALAGEDIIIAEDGKPPARLAPVKASYRGRGALKGQLAVGPEFFEPLPEDELKAWEGRE